MSDFKKVLELCSGTVQSLCNMYGIRGPSSRPCLFCSECVCDCRTVAEESENIVLSKCFLSAAASVDPVHKGLACREATSSGAPGLACVCPCNFAVMLSSVLKSVLECHLGLIPSLYLGALGKLPPCLLYSGCPSPSISKVL